MRSHEEMLQLILDRAAGDERIRAVTMEGSRANRNALHDRYSDFDICYIVTDVREFTRDRGWINDFGELLIAQYPNDWFDHPYDYSSHDTFVCLLQFADGNRIDLSLIDVRNIAHEAQNDEPRIVLMNKDHFPELFPVTGEDAYYIRRPSEKEYLDTCNEFRWLSVYITKGLCRRELYYAKRSYDILSMAMFIKMLNWRVAVDHDFQVTTGGSSKYLKRFLPPEEMERFQNIFPDGRYEDIWEKLFNMYDYFAENAQYVASRLGYLFDGWETQRVRAFLSRRRAEDAQE